MFDIRQIIGKGNFPSGPKNCITDVPGVAVGHLEILQDGPRVLRSGVTIILPEYEDPWRWRYPAGSFILNGCADFNGYPWIKETGTLQGPIALTSTVSLGTVRDTIYQLAIKQIGDDYHYMPVVMETDDSWLSDDQGSLISSKEVEAAFQNASTNRSPQGNVGGGTGMICHEFKGGIGTSSKQLMLAGELFTIGCMVQANYGDRKDLRLDGFPVGKQIPYSITPSPWVSPKSKGSILVVLSTDLPIIPTQCDRLSRRAALGLAQVGCIGHHDSGDMILCFSTCNKFPKNHIGQFRVVDSGMLDPVFEAVTELVHDAVWNALLNANTLVGQESRCAYSIDHHLLRKIVNSA